MTRLQRLKMRLPVFTELAACGSAAEVVFRIKVFGDEWSKADWAMFVSYVMDRVCSAPENTRMLAEDMVRSVREESLMDGVFTNRQVMRGMLEDLGVFGADRPQLVVESRDFRLRVLAAVFGKYPETWTSNLMWSRRKGRKRVHRMTYAVRPIVGDMPPEYWESDRFRLDFVEIWGRDAGK